MISRSLRLSIGVLALGAATAVAQSRAPIKAKHVVELDDPVGDVLPHQVGTADRMESVPAMDMAHLSIRSDGRQVTVAATLTEPPAARAGNAVTFYLDTDNDARTGVKLVVSGISGFEYFLELDSCVTYEGGHMTCGVPQKAKPTANHAGVRLYRYKGTDEYKYEQILDDGDSGLRKASVKTPVVGKVLQTSLDYQDLQVKPGQTIRIVAGEGSKRKAGHPYEMIFCPEILLTIK